MALEVNAQAQAKPKPPARPAVNDQQWSQTFWGILENKVMCLHACCVPLGCVCIQAANAKLVHPNESNSHLIACLLGCCCGCFGMAYNRKKLRDQKSIDGSYCLDLLCLCLCPLCSVTQEWREAVYTVKLDPKTETICSVWSKLPRK